MLQNLSGASEAGTVCMGSVVTRKHEITHSRYNISSELYANQRALNIRGEDRGFSSCLCEMVYYITFMEEDLQLWYSFVSVNILIEFR